MCIIPPDKLHWKKIRGNNEDFSTGKITPIKVCGNNVDFSTTEYTSKRVRREERMWILRTSRLYRKKHTETTWIFRPSKLHEKSTWKQHGFFDQRNYIEKVRGNDVEICRSSTYQHNTHVELTWIWRGVPVRCCF